MQYAGRASERPDFPGQSSARSGQAFPKAAWRRPRKGSDKLCQSFGARLAIAVAVLCHRPEQPRGAAPFALQPDCGKRAASVRKIFAPANLRFDRHLGAILRVHFLHDIPYVDFHRAFTHVQLVRYYLVGLALLDRPNDREFTASDEARCRRLGRVRWRIARQQAVRCGRRFPLQERGAAPPRL